MTAGDRVLAADINQFYNILKGVAASGEGVTLIYNAAGVLIFQPSSNPAAGTELVQIKNAAGTVQGALSSDGRVYAGDGTEALPAVVGENDKDTGIRFPGSNVFMVGTAGADRWQIDATGHLEGVDDNTYDIGSSGANRPRSLYVGTSIVFPDATSQTTAPTTGIVKEHLAHEIVTSEGTTSTSFTDLATAGPTVTTATATLNDRASVYFSCQASSSAAGAGGGEAAKLDAVATDQDDGTTFDSTGANVVTGQAIVKTYTALSAATHTIKIQYIVYTSGTATFRRRKMVVQRVSA